MSVESPEESKLNIALFLEKETLLKIAAGTRCVLGTIHFYAQHDFIPKLLERIQSILNYHDKVEGQSISKGCYEKLRELQTDIKHMVDIRANANKCGGHLRSRALREEEGNQLCQNLDAAFTAVLYKLETGKTVENPESPRATRHQLFSVGLSRW